MAKPIYQSTLPKYTGDFSFNESRLKELIKTAKPDYDPIDPKTWPVITSKYLEDWLSMPYNGSTMLPPFVAYDRELVCSCLQDRSDVLVKVAQDDGKITTHSKAFHHFPFACRPSGIRRIQYLIGYSGYSDWMSGVSAGAFAMQSKDSDTLSASPSASHEIINMVKDNEHVQSHRAMEAELAELKQQVAAAEKDKIETKSTHEKELAQERDRSQGQAEKNATQRRHLRDLLNREEGQRRITKRSLEELTKKTVSAIASHTAASARANAAEEKCRAIERAHAESEQLRQDETVAKDVALDAAQKETTILKEQMAKIRDVMKKAGYDGSQKRQVVDAATGGPRQKAKMEG